MKTEALIADVAAVCSPDRAERSILGIVLGVFWPIEDIFVIREQLCDVGVPSLAQITLHTQASLMKIEWLVTDVTSVGSPARAECAIFGGMFGVFWPI